ncbi:MAG: flavodoxin domain-containing protein [Pseudomonadota bacterium]
MFALGELDPIALTRYARQVFIVSTHGEGKPPTRAVAFFASLQNAAINLAGVQFAVLALGNRSYEYFCAFGKALHARLIGLGAAARVPLVEVHNHDMAVITHWREKLQLTFELRTEESTDWVIATVMEAQPLPEAAAVELALYVQCLEQAEAAALAVRTSRHQPEAEAFIARIVSDPQSPFTSIRVPTDTASGRYARSLQKLAATESGDKWLVKTLEQMPDGGA